jgi:hypothetical protein
MNVFRDSPPPLMTMMMHTNAATNQKYCRLGPVNM